MNRTAIFFLIIITLGLSLLLSLLGLTTLRANLLGWFLLLAGLVYFIGIIAVYWVLGIQFWRSRAAREVLREERHDRSFWFIVVGMSATFYLPPLEYRFYKVILPRGFGIQLAGLLLIGFGSFFFIWARRTLGNYYSGHVSVIERQPLVQSGPYHWIRHPAYAGYILIALGLTLGYSSLAGLAAILLLLLPSIVYRIHVEDKLLADHFGEGFVGYAKKTKRLLPGLW